MLSIAPRIAAVVEGMGPVASIYEPYGQLGALSNFSDIAFVTDNIIWRSVEHFFQAQKFTDKVDQEIIANAATPRQAKMLAWSTGLAERVRGDWDSVRVEVMRTALAEKFAQSDFARSVLLSTWPAPIVENSPSDTFWGTGRDGAGSNTFGALLTQTRQSIDARVSPFSWRNGVKMSCVGGASRLVWGPTLFDTEIREVAQAPAFSYPAFWDISIPEVLSLKSSRSKGIPVYGSKSHTATLDLKYGSYGFFQDARSIVSDWERRIIAVISEYSETAFADLKVVAVGAGPANESAILWARFGERATLIDAGIKLVTNCRQEAPDANIHRAMASNLSVIETGSADLYCSLRTYESALFDITGALREAFRVIRPRGICIISISNGYLTRERKRYPGHIIKNGVVDQIKPYRVLIDIAEQAGLTGFSVLEFFDIECEIGLVFRRLV